jgi:hypothetical protein
MMRIQFTDEEQEYLDRLSVRVGKYDRNQIIGGPKNLKGGELKMSELKKGGHVIFVDTLGKDRQALVTAIHGPADANPSINIVIVNDDDAQSDSYGNKIERFSSVVHQSAQYAHGNYWRFADEVHISKRS